MRVRRVERPAGVREPGERQRGRDAAAAHAIGDGAAGQVLHHDRRAPVDVGDVEDRDDVGLVREPRRDARLAREPRAEVGVACEAFAENLDGDAPAEHRVRRGVDIGHAPRRDQLAPVIARRERERARGHLDTVPAPSAPETASDVTRRLAARAPVRSSVGVALPTGLDRRAAPRARASGTAVDAAAAAAARDRGEHCRPRPPEGREQLVVRHLPDGSPRRDAGRPERLRHPHVPDPGDEPLVLKRLAERPPWIRAPEAGDERLRVGSRREEIGTEPAYGTLLEREHRAVPLRRLDPVRLEHEPRTTGALRSNPADPPPARHAQVTAHGHASLEAEQKVLSDRLDGLEPAPVDHASHACGLPSRVRRAGGDEMADERLQPESGAVEGVAFGHLR